MIMTQESMATSSPAIDDAVRRHLESGGKIQMMAKCPIRGLADFAVWYTPGVAAACRAIQARPEEVFDLTNRANTVAIVSDGTRVLGLGDIGPEAGLPVMEGKALLFKFLGGVDAVPLCVRTRSAEELCAFVQALEPSFGGINLEDISQPKCFACSNGCGRR
jgi:malate dehydrogenase (oxaloacetate-decarboxylating)